MRDHAAEPATANGVRADPADLGPLAVVAALPGPTAVFAADPPHFTLLAASDAFVAATGRPREALVGRPLAEAFPDPTPAPSEGSGQAALRASLEAAVRTGRPQRMARQRYDLPRPDGTWEARYWDALNTPVRAPQAGPGEAAGGAPLAGAPVRHVLHQTEDVTARVLEEQAAAGAELRAARVLERMGDAHLTLDGEFRITSVNAAAERVLGMARAAMLGRTHWEVFPASVDNDAGRAYRRVVAEGVEQHVVQHYVGEGYDRHLEIDAYPTEEGGVAVFWRDVTARVAAEAALRASEARYRAVFTAIDQAFHRCEVLTDAAGCAVDYRILDVNPAWARMTGLDPATAVGRTARELVPDQPEAWIQACGRVALERVPLRVEQEIPALGRWYDVHLVPFGEPDGKQFLATAADITARKRAEAERERLLAAIEEARGEAETARLAAEAANRTKAEFLATMSHEIRTPINAVVGYTQLLELGIPDPVTPAQREQLGRVAASARHLLGLVNGVLDVAKLDAGAMQVAREPATTGPAVAAAFALVRPLAGERGVRLVGGRAGDLGHPADPEGVAYVGDDARVRQILVNLLTNAVKFTEAGGTVAVASGTAAAAPPGARVAGAGPWAYVRIADTGVGIAPDQQAAVFEPFVQAEVQAAGGRSPYTRTKGGTGLGLTISRRLARLMGGDLTLESVPGAGATFTLWLPAAGVPAVGAAETPGARGERAGLPGAGWRVHGLGEIGHALRHETDGVLDAYTARLRADPDVPLARAMPQAQLEDHAVTLLADLAQSLVIIAGAGEEAAALMGDGTAIQRTVAEHHGARRFAQGWTEAAVRRDHAIIREVVERAVRARVAAHAGDVSEGLRVLTHLQARTEALSLAAYRHAAG